ncbi:tRNA (adenosine(37)-N6)-threonylcarbamoyltransferase complex ATPase subunit type 1 TsaE [Conexibacter sp. DBS9H8]|uniref:tRNA (adenosine(37)-N6)-threonylcarbamoyltransferase complex ATPase subunit type 1 TsaE n=1 Tax=Conexibacter sp. DBS9H8 TaxID=2937801 RepID=UPI00200FD742|nr:tRNA (adenosine(37)-N6)-threonylcarbamoyltransferase complex ATPase subunit type 1 TsaE [Conexibacter sp. DBS9H8]
MTVETTDSAGTERFGAQLAASLQPGDVVLLSGELGTGKTTLVRGAARALGVRVPVTSPTFAIGSRYPVEGPAPTGLSVVAHLDLYRLADLGAEDPDLLADYLTADAVAFIEWPGAGLETIARFGQIRHHLRLEHIDLERRRITVDAP